MSNEDSSRPAPVTVEQVADAIHGHPVVAAPYLGVWECTCGAPIRPISEQAERVAQLLHVEVQP